MGSAQTFNEIEMASPEVTQDYAGPYQVQVSSNGSSWTTAVTCQGITTPDIASFPSQTAQYVRVVLTGSNGLGSVPWAFDQFLVMRLGG